MRDEATVCRAMPAEVTGVLGVEPCTGGREVVHGFIRVMKPKLSHRCGVEGHGRCTSDVMTYDIRHIER